MSISFKQVINRLQENNLDYEILQLQGEYRIIVSRHGGRIFGPFRGEGDSVLWMRKEFADAGAFVEFLRSGDWNIGGDRVWIAPEMQYNVKDRYNFSDSYCLPAQVDPGTYSLEKIGDSCRLAQEMTLTVYPEAVRQKELSLERIIRPVADPLRRLDKYMELSEGVEFAGFEQIITLEERKTDDLMSEVWNLTQVNPGGNMYVCSTPCLEYTDYYEPVGDHQTINRDHVKLKVTCDRMYKVGYKSPCVTGRAAYHNILHDGSEYLLVRNWFNNPSGEYTKDTAEDPGRNGHSIHIYHDDGRLGFNAEIECSNQAIGGKTGRRRGTDQIITWLYFGSGNKLQQVACCLLGIVL